ETVAVVVHKISELVLCKDRIFTNITPQVFTLTRNSHLHLHSKGFFPEIEVQDFPIRGKAVYLRVKRRRWEDPETGQYLRLL
ncbi:MAG: hypothetical protein KH289_12630, partial [Bacteroides stercoris]|nr:hypothetical protein [Bacteroides stercoris]